MIEKTCIYCGIKYIPFANSINVSKKRKENSKFCNLDCYWKYSKENPNKGTFFKGQKWDGRPGNLKGELNNHWKGGQVEKICKICKILFKVDPYRKDAKTCSVDCRKKYFASEKFRESQSKIHRDKITPKEVSLTKLMRLIRKSYLYNIWRDNVHKKYNYTCQVCGKRGGNLQADHNEPYLLLFKKHNIDTYEKALACIELWDVDNGKTLCVKCHRESDTYGSKVHNAIEKLLIKQSKK